MKEILLLMSGLLLEALPEKHCLHTFQEFEEEQDDHYNYNECNDCKERSNCISELEKINRLKELINNLE